MLNAYIARGDAMFNILRKLPLEGLIVFFFKSFHVVGNMLAKYMLPVYIRIEGLRFIIVTRKSLDAVDQDNRKKN